MRLIHHPDAEAELIAAARFYERRVSTLGTQFLDAVDEAVALSKMLPNGGVSWKPAFAAT